MTLSDPRYSGTDGWGVADYPAAFDAIMETHSRLLRYFRDRPVYAAASKLIYFDETAPHSRLAADLIVVIDPPRGTAPRDAWLVWQEGKAPDPVLEIDQPRHLRPDSVTRRALYAEAGVGEYLVYNPRIHASSPPVQAHIGNPIPDETEAGVCSWHSAALDCWLHTLRGLPAIRPTDSAEPPYDAASYQQARQNINAELAQLHQQIAARYERITTANRWFQALAVHSPPAPAPTRRNRT